MSYAVRPLGREAIETADALKQIVTSDVRVFFYMGDRERTLDSPTDKIMLSLTTFTDELEREKARQRTYDAVRRKALTGQVTGGRVFGYETTCGWTPTARSASCTRRRPRSCERFSGPTLMDWACARSRSSSMNEAHRLFGRNRNGPQGGHRRRCMKF